MRLDNVETIGAGCGAGPRAASGDREVEFRQRADTGAESWIDRFRLACKVRSDALHRWHSQHDNDAFVGDDCGYVNTPIGSSAASRVSP